MTDNSTTIRGRSALVVGAGSGIGRAVALLLAQRGVATAAADLDTESVQRLSKEHPNVVALGGEPWDATDPTACDEMVTAAFSELGHLDQVITTVGWTAISPFLDESPEYWRRLVDVNLMSAIYVSAAAGRLMKEHGGGSIVLTSSEAGMVGTSGETVYSATKAGVVALAKSLAREFARFGIRVNAVAPGITDTPLLESQGGESLLARIVRQVPLRRAGQPDEIAAAIAFLASDEASYVTGQTLCVGGGLTMTS
jgi:NAD(P)-dependent dehydrogenase (short-subunit alcohol dehydrogenase family)